MTSRCLRALLASLMLATILAACTSDGAGEEAAAASPAAGAVDEQDDVDAEDEEAAEAESAAREAEEEAQREAEEQAEREAEEQAERDAEEQAEREAEEQAEREAEEQAEREAEEQARREAEEAQRREAEQRLREVLASQGYNPGEGQPSASAVMAFQKVNGLSRDGVVGPETLAAADDPATPPLVGGAATRIEVDLDRQVVHLVRGGERVRTLNASSGRGDVYTWPDGRRARADTPVGTFTIQRRVNGVRDGDLGIMYDPLYFHEGWAIHGSDSVPGHPASAGCVRLSRADGRWLADQVPNGTQVVVHGSVNAFDPATESVWL